MAIDKANVRAQLANVITDWTADFHTLDRYQVDRLSEVAHACGYAKPSYSVRNGSTARYFYGFLSRKG